MRCSILQAGSWRGNLRDRFLFALLAETGMRLGEALGLRIGEFVLGRGGTAYVEIVPREDNPNGARVKMMRPRRVYVGADLERLFADYLTDIACRAAEFGISLTEQSPLLVNVARPPLLAALRETTVREKVSSLRRRRDRPAAVDPALVSPHSCHRVAAGRDTGMGGLSAAWAMPTCKPPSIFTAGSARTKRCARRRTGPPTPAAGGWIK